MMQISIYFMNSFIMLLLVIIMNLISVAFLTLFERKIMGLFHYRKGPNKNSIIGFFQPFNDAIKLMNKEYFFPKKSSFYLYISSPSLMFILIMMLWLIYPFKTNLLMFENNMLYFLCMMSLGVYGLILSGWSSNSSFSMIGAIRSIAQSISYEVIFSISMLIILMNINSMNLFNLNKFNKFMNLLLIFLPLNFIILISMLAEINRTPFDLSEGESELVSGFNIEYSSSKFILIFLAEYSSMIFMMFLYCLIMMSSNLNLMFYFKIICMILFITWIRMTLPRIRYDKLMKFCWIYMLPITLILYLNYLLNLKLNLDFMLFS
uniref:NADH dehydrogenase subunit 1 n=1 Tax=Apanteles gelechiidivoris TaxID=1911542 RepID=UPI00286A9F17|nr:NADH dehydrogenase subunit 1 [Apanteles gelechiidivoris]WKW91672.1 NADH dehydrogenase subunit 1 [Apanteles gelechiidivoris]WLN31490.1 NADH dehydrogenase subunit 1 [Apanteles gelechiidivoris]